MSISACRIAVVLGATGGIGGETALALSRHGWKIRAFSRTTSPSSDSAAWEWGKVMPLTEPACLRRPRAHRSSCMPSTRPVTETGPSWSCR